MSYNSLAFTTAIVAVGSTELRHIHNGGKVVAHPVIAGFLLGLFLFAIGAASENIGSKLCVLLIITSLLVNGMAIFGTIDSALKRSN